MTIRTTIKTIFTCSLQRAFRSPMLCDIRQVHSGYGPMPAVTHTSDDETWGRVGGSRKVFMAGSLFSKSGEAFLDTVVERIENSYWKIELSHFAFWSFGISKLQGEWSTLDLNNGNIEVTYSYTFHARHALAYPFYFLITKVIWRAYMKHVIDNVRQLAYSQAPYLDG